MFVAMVEDRCRVMEGRGCKFCFDRGLCVVFIAVGDRG